MPTPMRALKTFTGRHGEGYRPDHLVEAGDDFNVELQTRVEYLERVGLAMRAAAKTVAKMQLRPANKMEPSPLNKAAEAGPLDSVGGTTGAEAPVPSLLPVRPRRGRPPKSSKVELLSSQ